jgi:MFS transporter, ACS family, solute carrier family 17 (sodium-dependent inorganic phosphate cotransporter), other
VIAVDEVLIVVVYLLGFFIPQRVVLSIMGFLAVVNAYTMRICLSVAITEMVVKKDRGDRNGTGEIVCPDPENGSGGSGGGGDFEWSEQLQGFILSAFFIGYVSRSSRSIELY